MIDTRRNDVEARRLDNRFMVNQQNDEIRTHRRRRKKFIWKIIGLTQCSKSCGGGKVHSDKMKIVLKFETNRPRENDTLPLSENYKLTISLIIIIHFIHKWWRYSIGRQTEWRTRFMYSRCEAPDGVVRPRAHADAGAGASVPGCGEAPQPDDEVQHARLSAGSLVRGGRQASGWTQGLLGRHVERLLRHVWTRRADQGPHLHAGKLHQFVISLRFEIFREFP